jgi:hypothetical protein
MSDRRDGKDPRPGREPEAGAVEALGGLARVAAGVWLRTATWGVGASVRVARAAVDPRAASELAQDLVEALRSYARDLLGLSDPSLDARIKRLLPAAAEPADDADRGEGPAGDTTALRLQGAELLRRSADVRVQDSAHPAYARILLEIAPDEARILRLLGIEGPQPAVDVRTGHLIGFGSQLVAEGLNTLGAQAGCRHPDRVPAYLNNLNRLGLLWFSKEPIEELSSYQVLEAQPRVLEAVRGATRARTVQRSIRLTPFGTDFCDLCLPLDELEARVLTEPRSSH